MCVLLQAPTLLTFFKAKSSASEEAGGREGEGAVERGSGAESSAGAKNQVQIKIPIACKSLWSCFRLLSLCVSLTHFSLFLARAHTLADYGILLLMGMAEPEIAEARDRRLFRCIIR